MSNKLFRVVGRIMGVSPDTIGASSSRETVPYWDSMKHIKLVLSVEEEFDVMFADDEIPTIRSVQNLIDLLGKKGVTL